MPTFGQLCSDEQAQREIGDDPVLVRAKTSDEDVIEQSELPQSTMVFMHETIQMMRAEREEAMEKLRQLFDDDCEVVPIRKKPESVWEHVTVGRSATADIVLDDPAVSNVHAHLGYDGFDKTVTVHDVGSSNGTFVNRDRLQPHHETQLRSGDCVRFGQSIFYFLSEDALREILQK